MANMTVEEREILIGKLMLRKNRCRFDSKELDCQVIDRMIGRLVDGNSPILENYYRADYREVKKLFNSFETQIWKYIGKLAEKTGDNQFDFLGRYYSGYSSYSYDNFGELVVNTFLSNRSEEILQALNPPQE